MPDELAALRGVRTQLARWAPPERVVSRSPPSARSPVGRPRSVRQAAVVARVPGVGTGRGGAALPRSVRRHREPRRAVRPERACASEPVGQGIARPATARRAFRDSRRAARPPGRRRPGVRTSRRSSGSSQSELRAAQASPQRAAGARVTADADSMRRVRALVERARSGSSASSRCASPK